MESDQTKTTLDLLLPENNDTFDKEPFDLYRERVSSLAPHIPDCVLENWIYRHYTCVLSNYSFLNFGDLRFVKETWSKEEIYHSIKSYDESWINNLGYQIYDRPNKSWLQQYMLNHMTWNVPIIVLENNQTRYVNHHHQLLGQPFHLLEGHLRLNYFRAIFTEEKEKLRETHEIWKATIK